MPIYEFVCNDCGHEFERIQSFSDSSVPACAICNSTSVQRQVSRPSIHFKGSGWYITDSKKDDKKPTSDTESDNKSSDDNSGKSTDSTDSKKESTSESSSDTKPSTKSEKSTSKS